LAGGLAAGLLIFTAAASVIGAIAVFGVYRGQSEQQRIDDLSSYARERAKFQQALFQDLAYRHEAATRALADRLASKDGAFTAGEFDTFFPRRADGTRRASVGLTSGRLTRGRTQGITGFMAGSEPNAQDKALLLAATDVVAAVGGAQRTRFDNFYFFTPQNQLVLFAPDQPAKLDFYSRVAPPSLNVAKTEMMRITLEANNPKHEMRCTRLIRLLSDPTGKTLTTGCMSPVYVNGRYVGAWGTTLPVTSYLLSAVQDSSGDRLDIITDAKGALIAYPGFKRPGEVTPERLAQYQSLFGLEGLLKGITGTGRGAGVTLTPNGRYLVAYGRIGGPDWYFLTLLPLAKLNAIALRSSLPLLIGGLVLGIIQAGLILWWITRVVAHPLAQLATEAERGGEDGRADASPALGARSDEIGLLARALSSERRKYRELLTELEDRVDTRTAELQRATAAKSDFLATMSHELRTPLNGVIALADLLAKRPLPDEDIEAVRIIGSSGQLLEKVLGDVLDFSKIEAGQLEVVAEPFDLRNAIRSVATLHRASADTKGLALEWSVADAVPPAIVGDSVRYGQVLSNLLSNAVKFTGHGKILLDVRVTDGRLVTSVTDTGIGFTAEVGQRLFNRFEQADSSISRRFGGTGLGLAISAALAQMMDGELSARSTPGMGSVFTLDLPLIEGVLNRTAERETVAALGRMKVLLAEDHPTNQKVVSLILADLDVDLEIAHDGAQAVDLADCKDFDVILMDVHMPVMDGLSATRIIREREAATGRHTPIVALTADALPEHVAAALAAGVDRHLPKPIRPELLIAAMADVLDA